MMAPPFKAGEEAARAGEKASANPFPKPEAPATGDDYPGDWANWLSGWCWGAERTGRSTVCERGELHTFKMKGVQDVGQ